ncbi:MAG: glycosyltransferase [Gemmatimonadetes bacterium]|nr:glycosyltransferase [Gemmatimonadota bacterium]
MAAFFPAPQTAPAQEIAAGEHPRPLFSVLIATYNQAAYIRETLDSVAGQMCTDYEVVVVDDGSTDGTGEVVCRWIGENQLGLTHPVLFSRIPNSGQSAAMEHGFALCSGRYICLLDSDDRWVPEKLAMISEAIRENPDAGMIQHPLVVIDPQGRRTGDVRPKRARLSHGDLREQFRRTGRIAAAATSGMVLRADIFQQLVPMPTKRFRTAADYYLAHGAALLAPVCSLERPLAEYRLHSEGNHLKSLTSAEGLEYWVDLQQVVARHFRMDHVLQSDSIFTRNNFARAKLRETPSRQAAALYHLLRATITDRSFGYSDRLLFGAFWVACFLSPRALFDRLWHRFQLKATGYDKILRLAEAGR